MVQFCTNRHTALSKAQKFNFQLPLFCARQSRIHPDGSHLSKRKKAIST